ncbi:MAG: GNAT family N-acetyltransferase [Rhodovibrionaceae bacterium]|nr:GNAT family N-acetyltransferase [Rhodovibrionaceae bacterium]
MSQTVIREAAESDAGTILRLIRELAEFERLAHEVRATEADIRRDGFGPQRYFECLLAEADGEAVGFALFFHDYSTFEGRPGIYLEDLFVREEQRGRGLGRQLIARLAALAVERDCRRLDLSVLHWNPARDVYERLGFEQKQDWLPYRLSGEGLRKLAESG